MAGSPAAPRGDPGRPWVQPLYVGLALRRSAQGTWRSSGGIPFARTYGPAGRLSGEAFRGWQESYCSAAVEDGSTGERFGHRHGKRIRTGAEDSGRAQQYPRDHPGDSRNTRPVTCLAVSPGRPSIQIGFRRSRIAGQENDADRKAVTAGECEEFGGESELSQHGRRAAPLPRVQCGSRRRADAAAIRGVRGVKPAGHATDCQVEGNSFERPGCAQQSDSEERPGDLSESWSELGL